MLSFLPYALVNVCTKSGVPLAAARGAAGAALGPERPAKPVLIDAPEVVLDAINERDRDHLAVVFQIVLGRRDVPLGPGDPQVRGDPRDHRAGVIAEVTARPREQGDRVRHAHRYQGSSSRMPGQPSYPGSSGPGS